MNEYDLNRGSWTRHTGLRQALTVVIVHKMYTQNIKYTS